jgi:hypothetical protein
MVEPCFEGAAFYSLKDNLEELIKYTKTLSEKEESVDMEKTLFRLSDNDKAELIAMALNPNFNEEGNWEMSSIVLDVYDDYALIGNVKTGGYQRAYYTKDGDNVTIGDIVDVYIVDVTATASPSGTKAFNQKLSEKRAKAVADFLTSRGVKVNSAVGKGVDPVSGRSAVVTTVQ